LTFRLSEGEERMGVSIGEKFFKEISVVGRERFPSPARVDVGRPASEVVFADGVRADAEGSAARVTRCVPGQGDELRGAGTGPAKEVGGEPGEVSTTGAIDGVFAEPGSPLWLCVPLERHDLHEEDDGEGGGNQRVRGDDSGGVGIEAVHGAANGERTPADKERGNREGIRSFRDAERGDEGQNREGDHGCEKSGAAETPAEKTSEEDSNKENPEGGIILPEMVRKLVEGLNAADGIDLFCHSIDDGTPQEDFSKAERIPELAKGEGPESFQKKENRETPPG